MRPLESLGDYIDINLIQNPWQMWVVLGLIFALLIWPQLSARQTVKRVEKTLTTNNGGTSVKDQNDRMERALVALTSKVDEHIQWSVGVDERVKALERPPKRKGLLSRR